MKQSVSQRIKVVFDDSKLSYRGFADKIKTSDTGIKRIIQQDTNPGAEILEKIVAAYPEISPAWLLTGEGEMHRNVNPAQINQSDVDPVTVLKEELDKKQEVMDKMQRTIEWFQEFVDRMFPGSAALAKVEAALNSESSNKVIEMAPAYAMAG